MKTRLAYLAYSLMVVGALVAAAIAKEAAASGRTIREVAREKTELSDEELDRILDPAAMTEPGLP